MKAEVTLSKRPKSGGQLRYLDLSFEGWTDNGMTNGVLDNGRKPHGGYKGLMKHPMGLHSFHKGQEYQQHLQQVRQVLEQEQRQSPRWALQVHSMTTHSGESPLLSGRLLSASKHETINGKLKPEKESPRGPRSATPSTNTKKAPSYYRPNRTHQYLTATELKDASDCDEVLRYGRPTRTTLLRARARISSASSSSYEARRQKEQRMMEAKKVAAFCSPEELSPGYTDTEEQSFYSFLLGARYNRAHCLDSRSLTRHGVYMPRNNPLGCFVIGDKTEPETAPNTAANSPRSEAGQALPRPHTERQRRPTTAPSFGRKSSARAPRTPRTPRSPRQAWGGGGDVTVSLHVTNGTRQTLLLSKEGPCKSESRLPVVHGKSLSKLQRFKEVPPAALEPGSSEALQPPPSPISARGEHSLPPGAFSLDPPPQDPPDHSRPLPPATDVIQQVSDENKTSAEKPEPEPEPESESKPVPEPERESEPVPEPESEHLDESRKGDDVTTEEKGEREGEEENAETVSEEREKGEETRDEPETEDGLRKGENSAAEASPGEEEGGEGEKEEEKTSTEDVDVTASRNDVTEGVTESAEELAETQPDSPSPQDNPATPKPAETEEGETNGEEKVNFFVTEQGDDDDDKTDDVGADISNAVTGDVAPSDEIPPDTKPEDDTLSTTSSKKSHPKHVSFNIPNAEDPQSNPDENIDDDKNDEGEDDVAPNKAGNGVEVSDSDVDDLAQGQGQDEAQEPLRVVVTHIEKSLGAPAPQESEEVIAEDP